MFHKSNEQKGIEGIAEKGKEMLISDSCSGFNIEIVQLHLRKLSPIKGKKFKSLTASRGDKERKLVAGNPGYCYVIAFAEKNRIVSSFTSYIAKLQINA